MFLFAKLRLSGFKSFADNSELVILPGLTGIVGPNGCGKSNLTEALRWLMGETSAKSLRGGEMDDVIFAGTGKRSSRNFAEVVLSLENPGKDAPDPYSQIDSIDISRRIDRGMGSDYRINGKIVRAGDVQLLFADSATGANSPSIVSQGRVTALIQAKPVDRRRVLEDAAAISGLHNRRKEAETRLRAAEKNLTRVDDLLGQKTATHEQLVKQAKQAERYKSLSETLRRLEALTMAMEWTRVTEDIEGAQASMIVANEAQNRAKQAMYDLSKQRDALAVSWENHERQSQELQQKIQSQQRLKERAEEELHRYEQTRSDLQRQRDVLIQDEAHEQEAREQANEKIIALTAEKAELEQRLANFTGDLEKTRSMRDEAKTAYETAQHELNAMRSENATLHAQRQMLHQQHQRLQNEKNNLANEQERVAQSLGQLSLDLGSGDVATLSDQVQQFEQALQATLDHVTQLEKQSEASALNVKSSYEELQAAQSILSRIDTEIKALASLAEAPNKAQNFNIVLDKIQVQSGFEQALSTAMGRELRAGLDNGAPMFWQERTGEIAALPENVTRLFDVVTAPDALRLALSFIGVVDDKAAGENLAAQLQPGQMLVSRDGFGWRWDGYTVTPQAQNTAQERETKQLLEQRNRLTVLRDERNGAVTHSDAAQTQYQNLQREQNTLRQQTTEARNQLNQLQRDIGQSRNNLARAQQKQAEVQARLQSLQEKQQDIAQRLAQSGESQAQLQVQIDALPPEAETQGKLETLQGNSRDKESAYRENDQAFLGMNNQFTQWQSRLQNVTRESGEWTERQIRTTQRLQSLTQRLAQLTEAQGQLKSPDHVQEQIAAAADALRQMEKAQSEFQSQRSDLSRQRQQIDAATQEIQENLMSAREALVRAETQFHNGASLQEQLVERCVQALDCSPENVAAEFGFNDEELGQNIQAIRAKQERFRNERERIGAVNLRAEEEAEILGTEITTLTTEKDDILAAIEKLRHGISTLNRDARKKMLAAFEEVNTRFKEVFTRLFNGGEAYLQLIDAEDPLEAGLEIFAQPPGKRLQALTLLSGGEQSLTAIALIFSMFLTHPSPICILDEIDAALDDANVERICSLLDDFTKTHPTRFLVITHNPITMTYMDRLYGVTMVEKGVSKLVSVDLATNAQPHLALAAD
ncbi:MAG: putative chromosome segregation protein [Alphaproteobacteria bacterium]|nr:putative chromosome segregation protein [Alphaproteobacteria bacterium]